MEFEIKDTFEIYDKKIIDICEDIYKNFSLRIKMRSLIFSNLESHYFL